MPEASPAAGSVETTPAAVVTARDDRRSLSEEHVSSPPQARTAAPESGSPFSAAVLNAGFLAGLFLAFVSLCMGGWYLYDFLQSTKTGIIEFLRENTRPGSEDLLYLAINARLAMARMALVSCGVFVGMAFGFLGFALFLIGAKGETEVEGSRGKADEGARVKLTRLAPGAFVILCSTILIGVCVTRRTDFTYQRGRPQVVSGAANSSGSDSGAIDDFLNQTYGETSSGDGDSGGAGSGEASEGAAPDGAAGSSKKGREVKKKGAKP